MALANPGKPTAGEDVSAEEILGNFEGLDVRTASMESVINNLTVDARTYGNGVFSGSLSASQVGTELQYSGGGFINTFVYTFSTTLLVDFAGQGADTYYVEGIAAGTIAIYTAKDPVRTNLSTVVWNGAGFDSVTEADRTVLATYQEIIDARGTFDTLEERLDAIDDGSTVLPVAVIDQTTSTLTLDETHNTIVCNTTSNGITITLPAVSAYIGYEFTIYVKTVSSGNHVTVNVNGADTFDGVSTSALMTLDDILIIRGLGNNRWLILDSTGSVLS